MNARHQEEIEFTLTAVVNAIEAGKLPPDDARAWARIAAYDARALAASAGSNYILDGYNAHRYSSAGESQIG
jgi:hypothetical protein